MKNKKKKVSIIGAGPAGLAVAFEFYRQKKLDEFEIEIYETDSQVGGIAKTLYYKGYRFDLGGHRFYTKFSEINDFYKEFLGSDMLVRKRLSRIFFENKFFNYPLSVTNVFKNLGIIRSLKLGLSWLYRRLFRYKEEKTFDKWVSNRFGDKLFNIFFKAYTEKLWGIPTNELSADWAAQRIQNFDFVKAVISAFLGNRTGSVRTLIDKFYYPKYGPGMLYERINDVLEKEGVKIYLNTEVVDVCCKNGKINSIKIKNKQVGTISSKNTDLLVSTMPFNNLVSLLKPPAQLQGIIDQLRFRNFLTVNLIIKSNPFPDNWIYIHDKTVKALRIQNFRNWSPYMVKSGTKNTPIGMEYFAYEGDTLWQMDDRDLLTLAKKELEAIGLAKKEGVLDGFVCRVKNAYPVYNFNYRTAIIKAKKYLEKFDNLYLCGRGGLFRYNNMDHSILTGFYVARNIISGEKKLDVWSVNEEENYLEKT